MPNLQIHDPIANRMNRMLRSFWPASDLLRSDLFGNEMPAFDMRIDVAQDDKGYVVRADMPGVSKDDIHVDVDGNQVSISAEVKKETEEKNGESVVYAERYQGKVYRSFTLDCAVDEFQAEANYKDGVLELKLPKKAETSSKRISVS